MYDPKKFEEAKTKFVNGLGSKTAEEAYEEQMKETKDWCNKNCSAKTPTFATPKDADEFDKIVFKGPVTGSK
jgi:hypothetical protein